MDDEKLKQRENEPQKPPVQYASPTKRLWAWVGVVYMVILVLFSTYSTAFGHALTGTAGLLLSPALLGLGGTAILRYRQGIGRAGGLYPDLRRSLCSGRLPSCAGDPRPPVPAVR